jgi:hypothetical protein
MLDSVSARLRRRHHNVILILAPPRTGSTALARALWMHPAVGWYVHEPFDTFHHRGCASAWADALIHPHATADLDPAARGGHALLVKEMSFQPGAMLPAVLEQLPTETVILLVADPRVSVASRCVDGLKGARLPCSRPPRSVGTA